ncbi:hypothetical protein [Bathymodiolus japonicus methanotrophic gill symbiont]|nr:hypothetical protein [Bathymodiolus japonicus methanotrophic gill symbiont]
MQARHATSRNSGTPVAYQGLKITTSLSSVSMIFSGRLGPTASLKYCSAG